MGELITVNKIGTGEMDNPFRPDTDAINWRVIEDRETEFLIEVLD